MFKRYIDYVKDNPKNYWFKAKWLGWGWTPVTWQGWLVIAVYMVLVIFLANRVEEETAFNIVAVNFLLPFAVLTVLLIRICYIKGEPPRWQWLPPKSKR